MICKAPILHIKLITVIETTTLLLTVTVYYISENNKKESKLEFREEAKLLREEGAFCMKHE